MRRYLFCRALLLPQLIHPKFGDGIMSLIDCKVEVSKKPDPKGDRVVLTFEYVTTGFSLD